MIRVLVGNLFDSQAQTLVNTVNCVGIMGKGVALEFKKRFPEMFKEYEILCKRKEVRLGRPYLYKSLVPPWILNFPTKDHWRSVSRLDDIIRGLDYLIAHYKEWGITSIALPPLGCGQGQLEWKVVGPTLYRYLKQLDIPVEMYAPYGTPHEELQPEFLTGESTANSFIGRSQPERIKPSWVALVEILNRIEKRPYHWPVGRTIFQKIVFVATREGLPTGLHYTKGSYGPFSSELKQLSSKLVNNGLLREEQLGKMLQVRVGPTFKDAEKAYSADLQQWNGILEKVSKLFVRLSTNEAEVVATVLFAGQTLSEDRHPTESDVLEEVMRWKQRRRPPLEKEDVAYTIRNLAALGWLKVKPSKDLPLPKEMFVEV